MRTSIEIVALDPYRVTWGVPLCLAPDHRLEAMFSTGLPSSARSADSLQQQPDSTVSDP